MQLMASKVAGYGRRAHVVGSHS